MTFTVAARPAASNIVEINDTAAIPSMWLLCNSLLFISLFIEISIIKDIPELEGISNQPHSEIIQFWKTELSQNRLSLFINVLMSALNCTCPVV